MGNLDGVNTSLNFQNPLFMMESRRKGHIKGFFFPLKLLIVLYALNVLCVGSPYYFSPREK